MLIENRDKQKVLPSSNKDSQKEPHSFCPSTQDTRQGTLDSVPSLNATETGPCLSPSEQVPPLLKLASPQKSIILHDSQVESLLVGAQLLAFADRWSLVTLDSWVLQTVRRGFSLEFVKIPRDRY